MSIENHMLSDRPDASIGDTVVMPIPAICPTCEHRAVSVEDECFECAVAFLVNDQDEYEDLSARYEAKYPAVIAEVERRLVERSRAAVEEGRRRIQDDAIFNALFALSMAPARPIPFGNDPCYLHEAEGRN